MSGKAKRPMEEVYNDHFSYVYNLIYMHVLKRELAEDLTEDVFVKALAAYASYDPERAGERTWLSTIAGRLLIDHYRAEAASRSQPVEDEVLAAIPCEDESLERVCDTANEAVRMLLSALEPGERHLLIMRYLMDMKNPQIAA